MLVFFRSLTRTSTRANAGSSKAKQTQGQAPQDKNRHWRIHKLAPQRTRIGNGEHNGRKKRTHKYRHYRTQRQAQDDTQIRTIGRKDRGTGRHKGRNKRTHKYRHSRTQKTGTRGHTDTHHRTQGQVQEDTRTRTRGHTNTGTTGHKDRLNRTYTDT